MNTQLVKIGQVVPDLVPARMLSQFTYCNRLFFLEWVQARFAHNADTVEGAWVHRAVDRVEGRAPDPDGDEPLIAARSLRLSSPELGIVGVADLVEGGPDGTVVPVDYKKGFRPDNPHQAWENDRVQLCAIGLLLREAGYRCDYGMLYYNGNRRRSKVVFDQELVRLTLNRLMELRTTAAGDIAPAPLVDSPKCPRCSLVGLCLPDETNALNSENPRPARRLMPSGDDAKPLHIAEFGTSVTLKKGRLIVSKKGEELGSFRKLDVSQLCVHGNVHVSTHLMRELMFDDVPICFFTYGGWFSGMAHGLPSKHVSLRMRQVAVAAQGGLEIARQVVAGKIANSRTMLMRNAEPRPQKVIDSLKELVASSKVAPSIESLLGIEGAAARLYFSAFSDMIKIGSVAEQTPFDLNGRNRRPPLDPTNCLLSYGYSVLAKEFTVQTFTVGLDPYIGFYHRPRHGRPALALDLAEEFRPLIVESTVLSLINNGEVSESDFIVRAGGHTLTSNARKKVLAAFERRMDTEITHPLFGYRISYRRVVEVQIRLLGAYLLGEVPHYVPFTTR